MKNNIGLVFAPQASQFKGMVKDLYDSNQQVQDIFSEASDILGYDMAELCFSDPESRLNQTEFTQPAILTVCWAIFKALNLKELILPFTKVAAGHSLGEIICLLCLGAIDFPPALKLVQARGRSMQEAVPLGRGKMVVIFKTELDKVEKLCQQVRDQGKNFLVEVANINSHEQIAVSGTTEGINQLINICRAEKIKIRELSVSVPFHCSLMKPAAAKFQKYIKTRSILFHHPILLYIANFNTELVYYGSQIPGLLVGQIFHPVKWIDTILKMHEMGVEIICEIGPKAVLSQMINNIAPKIKTFLINDQASLDNFLQHNKR